MLRKLLLTGILVLSTSLYAFAQSGSISGTVTDAETGEAIINANIYITSLERGAATDVDGEFTISNLSPGTYTLRVTFIGYKQLNRDVDVTSGNTTVNIQLQSDLIGLDDVIVTAQQIERQKREIGTSISTVSGEELTKARDTNVINSLSGKVPGVNISSQSGTAGGSSRIVIRGNSKLSGDTQPLFVIDGVPVSNSNIVGSSSSRLSGGAVDVGNRASDINPDDIANITVLRGASAAALYGQRAQNGVILVTTKKGKQGGTSVSINSSVRTNSALRLPDYQNEFAQGNNGSYLATNLNGWGPEITGQNEEQFPFNNTPGPDNPNGGTVRPLVAQPDNVSDFLRNGVETINNISVSGGNAEGGDFRLSITNTNSEGIVPGNSLKRNNISLNAGQQFSDKLSARATANYVYSKGEGRPVQGGNSPNAIISSVFSFPRTLDTGLLRNNVLDETGQQIPLTPSTNNPFFITRNNGLNNQVQRFFGSGEFTYSPLEWLDFTGRVGIDFITDNRDRPSVVGTFGRLSGRFDVDLISERQIDANFLVGVERQLTEDLNFDATLGTNINTRKREIFSNQSTSLVVPGLFNFGNAENNSPTNDFRQQRLVAAFFDATLGYKNYLFLNVTGRNDWSSTLPIQNRSFFYPSASVSFVFTEALDISNNILSFGKLRASAAQVGSDEAPYQLNFRFFPDSNIFGQFGEDLSFPFNGALAFTATRTRPPTNLKPQQQVSYEVGTELQFFDGRFGVDFTYYNNQTKDQIISIPIPQSSGFNAARQNAGTVENEGLEALVTVTPVRSRSFQWNTSFNYSQNNLTVLELAPGLDEITIDSGFNGLRIQASPGEELALFGTGWLRNDNGDILIDENTGLRQLGGEVRYGSQDPDFLLGINNSFNYKGINLSFLIDIQQGGTVVSGTVQDLFFSGLAQETADLRNQFPDPNTFIAPIGVIDNGDGTFRPNDAPVTDIQAYYQNLYQSGVFEEVAYDASYVKLREIKVGYSLPRKWLSNTPISSAQISFEGRNLWLIYAAAPHIDPETNVFGSGAIGQGIEFNNIPSVKSFGGNIRLSF